jgi:hypothetical protein
MTKSGSKSSKKSGSQPRFDPPLSKTKFNPALLAPGQFARKGGCGKTIGIKDVTQPVERADFVARAVGAALKKSRTQAR